MEGTEEKGEMQEEQNDEELSERVKCRIQQLKKEPKHFQFNLQGEDLRSLIKFLNENTCTFEKISFSDHILQDEDGLLLETFESLSKNTTIRHVEFCDQPKIQETRKEVVEFLEKLPALEAISFRFPKGGEEETLSGICNMVSTKSSIKMLLFSGICLNQENTNTLHQFISTNKFVSQLTLEWDDRREKLTNQVPQLFKALEKNSSIKEFHLKYLENIFTSKYRLKGFFHLHDNNTLHTLKFSSCKISSSSLKRLAEFLSRNKSVKLLDFFECGKNFSPLLESLKSNSSLESLVLKSSLSGEEEKIAELIAENSSLTFLEISRNKISKAMVKIFHSLRKNKTLKTFISKSTLWSSPEEKCVVGDVIRENCTLTEMDITSNVFRNEEIKDIVQALHHNSTLKVFAISELTKKASMIASMIRANNSLKTLNCPESSFSHDECIIEALKDNCTLTSIKVCDLYNTIKDELSLNRKIEERDDQTKVNILILQKRKDGNIFSKVPRRLLVHLLSFLNKLWIDKTKLKESILMNK